MYTGATNAVKLKNLTAVGNMGETKVMRFQVASVGQVEESGEYSCDVCRQDVGTKPIKCTG